MKNIRKRTIPVIQYYREDDEPNEVTVNVHYSDDSEGVKWIVAEFTKDYIFSHTYGEDTYSFIPAFVLVPMYYDDNGEGWELGYFDEMPESLQEEVAYEKIFNIDDAPKTSAKPEE